jgi:type IV pilus assembly protein PilW
MKKITQKSHYQFGFTLVELMVGLVIGLIATLVIMQTFASFEGKKRSTTGTSDAQTNGSIGLYMIQRELQFAGYGIPMASGTLPTILAAANTMTYQNYNGKTQAQIDAAYAAALATYNAKLVTNATTVLAGENYSALNCDNTSPPINLDADGDPATPNATDVVRDIITPVIITDGGVGSDTITEHYGTTTRGAMPTTIVSTAGTTVVGVSNNLGCRIGDVVLVTKDSNKGNHSCVVSMVTTTNAVLDVTTNSIDVLSNANMAVPLNNRLACMGKVRQVVFAINNSNQLLKNNQPVIGEIVNLQAQYGVSATPNSEVVNQWVDATGIWATPGITVSNRNRIKAVRIAVVARNNLFEKDVVSQACSGGAAGPAKVCIWNGTTDVNLATIPNWANYRYRTYEVIVPLRNVLSASPQL